MLMTFKFEVRKRGNLEKVLIPLPNTTTQQKLQIE